MKRPYSYLIILLLLISCGKSNESVNTSKNNETISALKQIEAGTYKIDCFLNRPATQGSSTDIYTTSTMTLLENGTGTNDYVLYSDESCTTPMMSGSTTIVSYSTIQIDGINVLFFDQDDGSSRMDIWIPYSYVNGNKWVVDVDFKDGNSGPYLVEPTPSELSEFKNDPIAEGINFTQQ